jgi:hypothetical protein
MSSRFAKSEYGEPWTMHDNSIKPRPLVAEYAAVAEQVQKLDSA